MTSAASSSSSSAVPVFIRIETNGDYRHGKDRRAAPFALRINAFADRRSNRSFSATVNPQEQVSHGVLEEWIERGEMGLKPGMDVKVAERIVNPALKAQRVFSDVMKEFVSWAGPTVTLIDHRFYHGAKATMKEEFARADETPVWERADLQWRIFDTDWFWKSASPGFMGREMMALEDMCRVMRVDLGDDVHAQAIHHAKLWRRVTKGADTRQLYRLMRGASPGVNVAKAVKAALPKRLLVLMDYETTGRIPSKYDGPFPRITEVAAKVFGDDSSEYQALVKPGIPIPMEVQKITGITDRMVAGKNVWAIEGRNYRDWKLRQSRFGIIPMDEWAHNGHMFDHRIQRKANTEAGIPPLPFVRQGDSLHWLRKATKFVLGMDLKSHAMDKLRVTFALPPSNAHRALDDVRDLEQLIYKMGESLTPEQWEQVWVAHGPPSRRLKGKGADDGWCVWESIKTLYRIVHGKELVVEASTRKRGGSSSSSSSSSTSSSRPAVKPLGQVKRKRAEEEPVVEEMKVAKEEPKRQRRLLRLVDRQAALQVSRPSQPAIDDLQLQALDDLRKGAEMISQALQQFGTARASSSSSSSRKTPVISLISSDSETDSDLDIDWVSDDD